MGLGSFEDGDGGAVEDALVPGGLEVVEGSDLVFGEPGGYLLWGFGAMDESVVVVLFLVTEDFLADVVDDFGDHLEKFLV